MLKRAILKTSQATTENADACCQDTPSLARLALGWPCKVRNFRGKALVSEAVRLAGRRENFRALLRRPSYHHQ